MILVFGENGQLASSLKQTKLGEDSLFVGQQKLSFANSSEIEKCLDLHRPELIINAAAYTKVDLAETERELCEAVNHTAVETIAKWAARNKSRLIHISTDYVFSGDGDGAWTESSATKPLNWYGETKRRGEAKILSSGCEHFIFRTSWVFSEFGQNFLKTMLRLGREKAELKIVADQVGSPTYAGDLAMAIVRVAGQKAPSGTYHLTNHGWTSWYDFAREIFKAAEMHGIPLTIKSVLPISTAEYTTPAQRPLNSRLDLTKFEKTFGITMPSWQDALSRCLHKLESVR